MKSQKHFCLLLTFIIFCIAATSITANAATLEKKTFGAKHYITDDGIRYVVYKDVPLTDKKAREEFPVQEFNTCWSDDVYYNSRSSADGTRIYTETCDYDGNIKYALEYSNEDGVMFLPIYIGKLDVDSILTYPMNDNTTHRLTYYGHNGEVICDTTIDLGKNKDVAKFYEKCQNLDQVRIRADEIYGDEYAHLYLWDRITNDMLSIGYLNYRTGKFYKNANKIELPEFDYPMAFEWIPIDDERFVAQYEHCFDDVYLTESRDGTECYYVDSNLNILRTFKDAGAFTSEGYSLVRTGKNRFFIIDKDFNVHKDCNIKGVVSYLFYKETNIFQVLKKNGTMYYLRILGKE